MSRPAHIEAQRENIYLEFLDEGMTEKEAEEAMEKRIDKFDPNYGDNTICDSCGIVFDVRNSPHEVIDGNQIGGPSLWLCGNCCFKDEENI